VPGRRDAEPANLAGGNLSIAVTVTDSLSRVAKTMAQLEDSILIGLVTPKGEAHGT
jgi:hypothetical protein